MIYLSNREILKGKFAKNLLGNVIIYEGPPHPAVDDLKQVMEEYCNKKIVVSTDYQKGEGVFLKKKWGFDNSQDFEVEISSEKATIWYNGFDNNINGYNTSLANGVYYLLNHLGIEWLTANDKGLHMPDKLYIPSLSRRKISPAFLSREEFGTGGHAIPQGNKWDEFHEGTNYWYKWSRFQQRLRYSKDHQGPYHGGADFYYAKKDILDQHEDWFIGSGKVNGFFKIEIPEAMAVYKAYCHDLYEAQKQAGYQKIVINIDPADGRANANDPLPPPDFLMPDGVLIKNHADKYAWIANQVAREFEDTCEDVAVTYLIYNGDTNVVKPGFPLHQNVYPVLVPYQFQKAYYPLSSMLDDWNLASKRGVGIYDYSNITQWSQGLNQPDFQPLEDKIKKWKKEAASMVILESMDAGCIAHRHYVVSKALFEGQTDFRTSLKHWTRKMFGDAHAEMYKLVERWSYNNQGAMEAALSLQNLADATVKVKKYSLEWQRIQDYKAYVHWMVLFYKYQASGNNLQDWNNLYLFMFAIHQRMMVQTAAFVNNSWIYDINGIWSHPVPNAANIEQLTDDEIEVIFEQDLLEHTIEYTISSFALDHSKATLINNEMGWVYGVNPEVFFIAENDVTELFVGAYAGPVIPNPNHPYDYSLNATRLYIIDSEEKIIVSDQNCGGPSNYLDIDLLPNNEGTGQWRMQQYSFNTTIGKKYRIKTFGGNSRVRIINDEMIWHRPAPESFNNIMFPVQYFYCPLDINEIVFSDILPGLNGRGTIRRMDGTVVSQPVHMANHIYKVDIEPDDKGTILYMDMGHADWYLLNIENLTSLQPFTYQE